MAQMRQYRRTIGVLVAAAVGFVGSSAADDSVAAEVATDTAGLRSTLPEGLDSYVSEDALSIVLDPAFKAVRAHWNDDIALVDQVDYQLAFRAQADYLDSTVEHLAGVLLDRAVEIDDLELYFTKSEAAEFMRRKDLGETMEAIEATLGGGLDAEDDQEARPHDDDYVGVWMDQLNGGAIVVAVREGTGSRSERSIASLEVEVGSVRVVEQALGLEDLTNLRDEIMAEARAGQIALDADVVPGADGFKVEVTTLEATHAAELLAGPEAEYLRLVAEAPPAPSGNPLDLHSWADQQPGLAIRLATTSGDSNCGWGFNGHTSSYTYIVMAGHCGPTLYENYTGWTGSAFEVSQTHQSSEPRIITPGDTYVYSVYTNGYDAKRVESSYANDNCYHGKGASTAAHCEWPMHNRAGHNTWEPGSDTTCISLSKSNTYRCAFIEAENQCTFTSGNCRAVRVGVGAQPGDSGSGAKATNTIDGVLADANSTRYEFITAYDVKNQLGFDFNCAVGQTTQGASAWGSCAWINR